MVSQADSGGGGAIFLPRPRMFLKKHFRKNPPAVMGGGNHFGAGRPGIFYNTDLRLSAREFLRLDSGFGLRLETAERRKVQ